MLFRYTKVAGCDKNLLIHSIREICSISEGGLKNNDLQRESFSNCGATCSFDVVVLRKQLELTSSADIRLRGSL